LIPRDEAEDCLLALAANQAYLTCVEANVAASNNYVVSVVVNDDSIHVVDGVLS
jgi:hypothetical protein